MVTTALLLGGAWVVLPGAAASAAELAAPSVTPSFGGSTTPFQVTLPPGAACSGDTATGGYSVYSYVVPSSVDPSTLTFSPIRGANQGVWLLDLGGSPYESQPTQSVTGAIIALPQFSWAAYQGDFGAGYDLYAGVWNVGVACVTRSGAIDGVKVWNIRVTFSASASDPGGFTWAAGRGSGPPPPPPPSYVPISGAGSTWPANALASWIAAVKQDRIRVNYAPTGSIDGRHQFLTGRVDFAVSDIPFQSHPDDGSLPEAPLPGSYAYMPATAGGTSFIYNLSISGQRVTNLRLSGENITRIYTGRITNWNDPVLAADNPGLTLPDLAIVPVVRADANGSTQQLTSWMNSQYPALWNTYCQQTGSNPCRPTTLYPTLPGMVAQNGDLGVAGYVVQPFAAGAIGYVQYSDALNAHFPVAKMLNKAGYYTAPTPDNVAVSLLQAQIDTTDTDPSLYLTQKLDNVYTDADPRTYPLSSYSYLILHTTVQGAFSVDKGKTLAAFGYYGMCRGQQSSAELGYAPMPINLVQAAFQQLRKIPGADVQSISIGGCDNPTFTPDGTDLVSQQAPYPPACDQQGPTQCDTGPNPALPEGRPALLIASAALLGAASVVWRRRRLQT